MSVLKVKKDGVWESVSGTSGHTHTIDDITNFPEIKPDGGDADTVDGKHASDFASASDVSGLKALVGDTSVAEQISSAVSKKSDVNHTHSVDDVGDLSEKLKSKYEKPSAGILKDDLEASVQTSLGKADTAVQSLEGYATEDYVKTQVSSLVDAAPETLNTLNELATALGEDANFAATVATQIGTKVDKVDGKGLSTNDYTDTDKETLETINSTVGDLVAFVGDKAVSEQISDAVSGKADKTYVDNAAGAVTPEMYGAVGDGVTCDADAFITALKTGKKVVCDTTKTYYFSKPVDVRTLLKGHLDGNNAQFVNFHIYINVNEAFNGQQKAYTADRFIIENMILGNEHSYTQILEGWETPCITSGSPMIIKNIITRSYPYVYALVGTYIDLIQVEQWTNAVNSALYEGCDINLDAISYLNSNGQYARFDNTDLNTIQGDGWRFSQCQEFYNPLVPEYKFFGTRKRLPSVMEQCVQCSVDVFDSGQLVLVGCHYENATIRYRATNGDAKVTFINTYFYATHDFIDNENATYINCFFQCAEDRVGKRPLAAMTGNKSWYDLKCDLIGCVGPTTCKIDTRKLKSYKAAPKKTYTNCTTHYAINRFTSHTPTLESRWWSTYFEAEGEYIYDVCLFTTSLDDVAVAHKQFTITKDASSLNDWVHSQARYACGGVRLLIFRTNPDGTVYKTEYYVNPSLTDNADTKVILHYYDGGSLAMFQVDLETDYGLERIATPWVLIDSLPTITTDLTQYGNAATIVVNSSLFEANGVLVTTDGSTFNLNEWRRYGLTQPATIDQVNSKVPLTRTVNSKALSADITLTAEDVGADPAGSASTVLTNANQYTNQQISEMVGDTNVSAQIATAIAAKSDSDHNHNGLYDAFGSADGALASAKQYTNDEVAKKTQVQIITWEADD